MKGSASACLLTLGASVASAFSCAQGTRGATVDLLARRPDDADAAVQVDLERHCVRLPPEAVVRYRVEARVPGSLRIAARSAGRGTLEAAWFALGLASGTEERRAHWSVEVEEPGGVERVHPLAAEEDLMELRLAWRAAAGEAELELHELELHELELRESTPVERPSIVLIVIDALSAQHLSLHGYPLETDPELRRFASESLLFEHCFSNAPWTVPSFMSLMTGLYARAHEHEPTGAELWNRWYLGQDRWTLAESLRAAGCRTAGFVDNTFLAEQFGFAQGFDVYDSSAAADNYVLPTDLGGGFRRTTAQGQAFLAGLDPETPFFLFVHAFDVHQPYTEKPAVEERSHGTEPYDLDRRAPAGGSGWTYGIVPTVVARLEVPTGELPTSMPTAPIERAYDESIRFLDEELGKFLEDLRARGILERSWVIFTADHGESMGGAIHLFGHGLLDQEVMHVPLLVRPPGGCPGGKRIAEAVQLADLYPTLIELAGLECRTGRPHGRSLVPLLRDEAHAPGIVLAESGVTRQAMLVADGWKLVELEPTKDSPPEARLSNPLLARALEGPLRERIAEYFAAERRAAGKRAVRSLAWTRDVELRRDFFERMPETGLTEELLAQMKTRTGYRSFLAFVDDLLAGPFYELYQLDVDPLCRQDVASDHPEKVAELRALLEQEKRRREDAARAARPPDQPLELPDEELRALKALGYGSE